jgi:hypothetical protein
MAILGPDMMMVLMSGIWQWIEKSCVVVDEEETRRGGTS